MSYSLSVNGVLGNFYLTVSGGRSPVLTWPSIEVATTALSARGYGNCTNARTSTRSPMTAYVVEAPFGLPTVAAEN